METEPIVRGRSWAVGAAVLGVALFTLYIVLILGEGNNSISEILPWATLMAFAALGGAVIPDAALARRFMIGAALLFSALGVVSLFTIGIGFLLAAFVTSMAAARLKDQECEQPTHAQPET